MDPVHLGYHTHNMHSINPMGVVPHDLVPLSHHYTRTHDYLLMIACIYNLHPCYYMHDMLFMPSYVLLVLHHDVL